MTWSIIVRDAETGFYAMGIASKFFAAGAICMWSGGAPGAAFSQALPNPELGHRALGLLREGHTAASTVEMLVAMDRGIEQRQLHVMDATGTSAAYTGSECIGWCGHVDAPGVSVAGNMLAGRDVVEATLSTWLENANLTIVERIIAAMQAGEDAGGDMRGKQCAAVRVQGPEVFPRLDIRVDDHAEPMDELRRLYAVARERFIAFSAALPRRARPYGILDRAIIERMIERDRSKPWYHDPDIPEGP